jgi:hypothetical protein
MGTQKARQTGPDKEDQAAVSTRLDGPSGLSLVGTLSQFDYDYGITFVVGIASRYSCAALANPLEMANGVRRPRSCNADGCSGCGPPLRAAGSFSTRLVIIFPV